MSNPNISASAGYGLSFDGVPVLPGTPVIDLSRQSYPPYNLEQFGPYDCRIVMSVAGFGPDDVTVTESRNRLTVRGESPRLRSNGKVLHRSVHDRFERRFHLADGFHLADWLLRDGLLIIDLERDPPKPAATMPIPLVEAAGASMAAPLDTYAVARAGT